MSSCLFHFVCRTFTVIPSLPWSLIICTSGHETHSWWSPCPTWWVWILFSSLQRFIAAPCFLCKLSNVSCVSVSLLTHIFFGNPELLQKDEKHNHFRKFQGMIDLWDVLMELISLVYRCFIAKRGLLIKSLTYFSHGGCVLLLISLSVCLRQTSLCLSCPS